MNPEVIEKFLRNCVAEGLGKLRITKYRYTLNTISGMFKKPFEDISKEDIVGFLNDLEKSKYSDWSKHDFKVALKKFFKWLKNTEDYPEEVRWIKTSFKNGKTKLPEELLTEEEIEKMLKACYRSRDRAFISLLYESGCRIGEVLSLRIKHLSFDKYGVQIMVDGKTGMRRIRLVMASPYLTSYLDQEHKNKDNPKAYLFQNDQENFLSYQSISKILRRIGQRAGIKKALNPHIFRHSRATYLANYLTEAQMKQYFGWVQSSEMASIYVHMSGRDVDKALLSKVYGLQEIKEQIKQEQKLKPKKCPRCGKINELTNSFCGGCTAPLTIQTAINLEEKRKEADNILDLFVKEIVEKYPEESKKILTKLEVTEKLKRI